METITRRVDIQDFGALKKVTIDLNKEMMVVIGAQASGKSTLGKVIYFCRKIRDFLSDYAGEMRKGSKDELFIGFCKYLRRPFMGCFGTTKHMGDFMIKYFYSESENRYVQITLDQKGYAVFTFSSIMKKEIQDVLKDAEEILSEDREGELGFKEVYFAQSNFINLLRKQINKIFMDDDKLLYIPAGRNLLATIPDIIFPKEEYLKDQTLDISRIDMITQDFARYIQSVRARFGTRLSEMIENYRKTEMALIQKKDVAKAQQIIHEVLKADYVYENDSEKLYYSEEGWVKLMFGSSGQQEVLWALNCIFLAILQNEKTFLVFEEPESHLFPDSQELIVQLVALMINSTQSEVVITTHSPYMLTAMNLALYSGEIEGEVSQGNSIVDLHCRLKSNKVSAFHILEGKEGNTMKNIMGSNRGLIDALEIDQISDRINDSMDRLLMMKLKKGE